MASREGRSATRDSPAAAARFVRRGAAAIRAQRLRSGSCITQSGAERLALIEWAKLAGKLVPFDFFEGLSFIGEGAEHRVYHDQAKALAIKATSRGGFGHSTYKEGWGATPLEYLFRLGWHNQIFGDDIHIVGVSFDGEQHVEIVHSQPWIDQHSIRSAPFPEEIERYFANFGFLRCSYNADTLMFYSAQLDLIVADAHDANVIRDSDGEVVAIDVVIGYPGPGIRAMIASQI